MQQLEMKKVNGGQMVFSYQHQDTKPLRRNSVYKLKLVIFEETIAASQSDTGKLKWMHIQMIHSVNAVHF